MDTIEVLKNIRDKLTDAANDKAWTVSFVEGLEFAIGVIDTEIDELDEAKKLEPVKVKMMSVIGDGQVKFTKLMRETMIAGYSQTNFVLALGALHREKRIEIVKGSGSDNNPIYKATQS